MTGPPRTNSESRDPFSQSERAEVIAALERIRELVHGHLERFAAASGVGEREQALVARVAELEREAERASAELNQHRIEWEADLQRLEADRRLLADAWDAIERERIASRAPTHNATPTSAVAPAAEGSIRPRAAAADDPITRAMLQQFQALKQDVRRNAARRSGT